MRQSLHFIAFQRFFAIDEDVFMISFEAKCFADADYDAAFGVLCMDFGSRLIDDSVDDCVRKDANLCH